ELSRTADVVGAALTELTGATSPRLHLELMIARVLVPEADDTKRGTLARVERLERRIGIDGSSGETAAPAPADTPATLTRPDRAATDAATTPPAKAPARAATPQPPAPAPAAEPAAADPAPASVTAASAVATPAAAS